MPPEVTEPARQQRGDDTASVVADELYAEGVDALIDGDYFDASNSLSQCLQAKASLFGEDSLEAALVAVKYGSALLACLRARRDDGELAHEQVCLRGAWQPGTHVQRPKHLAAHRRCL